MGERGLAPDALDAVGEEFFDERRRRYGWLTTPRSLAPLRRYLVMISVVRADSAPVEAQSPAEELIGRYRRYLERERGLSAGSIELYLAHVRRLTLAWWSDGEVRVGELDAAGIIALVRREADCGGGARTKTMVCALRSFLRFLYAIGLTERPLAQAVPSLADRRRESIPRYLHPEVLTALLGEPVTPRPSLVAATSRSEAARASGPALRGGGHAEPRGPRLGGGRDRDHGQGQAQGAHAAAAGGR